MDNKEIRTFEIENLAQTTGALKVIEENFKKEDSEQASIIIRFVENIEKEEFLESLKQFWEYEIEFEHTIDILIKNLSYDYRKDALGLALKTPELRDPNFLMNVFCLIKGYNTFDESYFNHEQVFLNDEVEFLDIFDDLEKEIQEVTYKVAEYYVSMLKTCHLIEGVMNNPNTVRLENLYAYLFDSMDVTILAKILSSVKDPAIWETKKIVLHSLNYLGAVAEKFVFTNRVLDLLSDTLLAENIKKTLDKEE